MIGTRSAIFAPLARPGLIVSTRSTTRRTSSRTASATPRATWRSPGRSGSASRSCWARRRRRSKASSAFVPARATLLDLPNRTAGATPPQPAPDRPAHARRHAGHCDADAARDPASPRRGRPGAALPEPTRLRAVAVLPRLRLGRAVPALRRATHRAPARTAPAIATTAARDQPIPEICPDCGEAVKPVGQGTERIEETLADFFPEFALARIDRDAVRQRGSLEEAHRARAQRRGAAAGRHADADQGPSLSGLSPGGRAERGPGLFGTDFRAAERLAQTIVQVAGRAGRAEQPGEVLIQTEYPEHPLLQQLVTGGYDAFAAAALVEREQAHWPPFARVAVLRAEAPRTRGAARIPRSRAGTRATCGAAPASRCSARLLRRWSAAPAITARS